jgi:transcriptional regulator GlxA family with amidase domain
MLDVTVVLIGGNYCSTAIGAIEVFHAAGQLFAQLQGQPGNPQFRVTPVSVHGTRVDSAYHVGLHADKSIDDIERTDVIVVSAAGLALYEQLTINQKLLPWLKHHADQGAWVAGMCTGAAFLAAAGLLDDHDATSHWGTAPALQQLFPRVRWRMDRLITEDRRMLCSGGVYASIDLSVYLVEKFCGYETAVQTAKTLLIDMPRSRQSAYAILPLSKPHDDQTVRRAEECIQDQHAKELSVEGLARQFHMSPRNFIRRFKAATGRTPGQYLQATRIAVAKSMLENGARSVETVGNAVGYEDNAFFRALFRRETGFSPAEYRERFRNAKPAAATRGD